MWDGRNRKETGTPQDRETFRVPVVTRASLYRPGAELSSACTIADLSSGGAGVTCAELYALGTRVVLRFSIPDREEPFQINSTIVYSRPGKRLYLYGLRFDAMDQKTSEAITRYLFQIERNLASRYD